MKLRFRQLRSGDQDYELILGVLYLPLLLFAGFVLARLPYGKLPICRFRAATGIPCPTCGIVRCFRSFLAGEGGRAFVLHPLGAAIFAASGLVIIYSLVTVLFKLPRPRLESAPPSLKLIVLLSALLLILANWLYLLAVSGVFNPA